ncbi:MAG: glycosylase, partial [Lachnospiraceae bacterium]|nr:glycosylase [Lachnospiraceae bacterium]
QWDASVNAGFSTAATEKLYIPLDPSPDRPTAEKEMRDDNSLRSEVKRLIGVRQAHPALQSIGEIEFICDGAPGKPLCYLRSLGDERILVIINPTDVPYESGVCGGKIIYSFGTVTDSDGKLAVAGGSAVFMKLK